MDPNNRMREAERKYKRDMLNSKHGAFQSAYI